MKGQFMTQKKEKKNRWKWIRVWTYFNTLKLCHFSCFYTTLPNIIGLNTWRRVYLFHRISIKTTLTLFRPGTRFGVSCKQCRPSSDTALCGVSSGSTCLLTEFFIEAAVKWKQPPETSKTWNELISMIRIDNAIGQKVIIYMYYDCTCF